MMFDFKYNKYSIVLNEENEDLCNLQQIKFSKIEDLLCNYTDIHLLSFEDVMVLIRGKQRNLCSLETMLKIVSIQDDMNSFLLPITAEQIFFIGTKISYHDQEYFPCLLKWLERVSIGKKKIIKKTRVPGVTSVDSLSKENFLSGVVAYYV